MSGAKGVDTDHDVLKAKSAAMAIGLTLAFGGCAGRAIGYAEGRDGGLSGKLQVRCFEIPRGLYASDAARRGAVRQAGAERR